MPEGDDPGRADELRRRPARGRAALRRAGARRARGHGGQRRRRRRRAGRELERGPGRPRRARADLRPSSRPRPREPGALAGIVAGAARRRRAGCAASAPTTSAALVVARQPRVGAVAARRAELGEAIELLRPLEDELLRRRRSPTRCWPTPRRRRGAHPGRPRARGGAARGQPAARARRRAPRRDRPPRPARRPGARGGGARCSATSTDGRLDRAAARAARRAGRHPRALRRRHPARGRGDRLGDQRTLSRGPDSARTTRRCASCRSSPATAPAIPYPEPGETAGALAAMLSAATG